MVMLYHCEACLRHDHGNCAGNQRPPPGHYGGSKCKCPCDGDAHWETRMADATIAELLKTVQQPPNAALTDPAANPKETL